jgi:hypothetical protein
MRSKTASDARPRQISPAFADLFSEEHLRRRREAMARDRSWEGVDDGVFNGPVGHANGVATSTRLTSDFRRTHRKKAMDITPQQVIDVLVAAGVKKWVLMGLHGYAGYLPEPRATQDVDIMVPYSHRKRAVKAVHEAWPKLLVTPRSEVVRFTDPNDLDPAGNPKPVIDLMMTFGEYQKSILRDFVVIDRKTKHRIPRLEAALVAKYAPLVSLHRSRDKRELDAADFRRMVRANHDRINRDQLRRLADEIWKGAGKEILQFVEIAMSDEPFPV